MKANEAPEKIYLNQDDGLIWHCRSYKDDIEYIRTDAFIEKACKWIETHICVFKRVEEVDMFKDLFKKAMEEQV